ncbi:hypothetical protein K438DRAFT_1785481 [Mycena galopus ATCC 62051]|nr:hypothetical protein K438DRAFT_1785481 [Mycena galopus ATCC 62051]
MAEQSRSTRGENNIRADTIYQSKIGEAGVEQATPAGRKSYEKDIGISSQGKSANKNKKANEVQKEKEQLKNRELYQPVQATMARTCTTEVVHSAACLRCQSSIRCPGHPTN